MVVVSVCHNENASDAELGSATKLVSSLGGWLTSHRERLSLVLVLGLQVALLGLIDQIVQMRMVGHKVLERLGVLLVGSGWPCVLEGGIGERD